MVNFRSILFGAALLSAVHPSEAAPASSQQQTFVSPASAELITPEISRFIASVLKEWHSEAGMAVGIVKLNEDGSWTKETKGFGSSGNDRPVDGDTLFCIASNSKLFTALSTALLIRDHPDVFPMGWNTKIIDVLPSYGLSDEIANSSATLLDLGAHRTGLPRHDLMPRHQMGAADIISRIKHLRTSAELRETWQYNNLNLMTLAHLPTLFNTTFTSFVTSEIFSTLEMKDSSYSPTTAAATGKLAVGHARVNISEGDGDLTKTGVTRLMEYFEPEEGVEGNAGAGGVITSTNDMATWLQMLLLNGRSPYSNTSIFTPSEISNIMGNHMVMPDVGVKYDELSIKVYGLGQEKYSYRGVEVVEHGGSVPGFLTQALRIPSKGIGIITLSNDGVFGTQMNDVVKWRIMDTLLGLEPIDWSSRYKKSLQSQIVAAKRSITPPPKSPSSPSFNLSSLTGVYSDAAYGSIELCLVSSSTHFHSEACQKLIDSHPTILPGVVDDSKVTLLAEWDGVFTTHIKMVHFNGDVWNVTQVSSWAPVHPETTYFTSDEVTGSESSYRAEFSTVDGKLGFGWTGGMWGAGPGVESPADGDTVKERSEIWFDKI